MRTPRSRIRLSLALVVSLAVITACEKEDSAPDTVNNMMTVPMKDTLQDIISENTLLTNTHPWYIKGWVYLGNEATLSIEPGTVIKVCPQDETHRNGGVIVTRGAKLLAHGSSQLPVYLQPADTTGTGWTGIIILGKAPQRQPFTTFEHKILPEGASLAYGGNQPDDSSGVLQHVRIGYIPVKGKQPSSGLLLLGTGKKTIIKDVILQPLNVTGAKIDSGRLQ